MKTFARTLYGDDGCVRLAKEWARRDIFYYRVWEDHGREDDFAYTNDLLEAYPANLDFVEWACEQAADSEAFNRVWEVQHARPQNP